MKGYWKSAMLLLFIVSSNSAFGATTYLTCHHCDPGDTNNAQVHAFLTNYLSTTPIDGKISIQDDELESIPPNGLGYYQVTYTRIATGWYRTSSGMNPVANNGGGGEGGNPGTGNGGGYVPPGATAPTNPVVTVGPIGGISNPHSPCPPPAACQPDLP